MHPARCFAASRLHGHGHGLHKPFPDDERLFKQLNYFTPPILLLFFVRSGLNFDLSALFDSSSSIGHVPPLIVVGVCYFFTRIIGKYAGAFLGCLITKKKLPCPQLSRSRADPAGGRCDRSRRDGRAHARRRVRSALKQ